MAAQYQKYNDVLRLYEQGARQITVSSDSWRAFLVSAGYNFKLPFENLVLLHAQKPEATAVLPIQQWNQVFDRYVNKGAKGIRLFKQPGGNDHQIIHVFDLSDTHPNRYRASDRQITWSMREEYVDPVIESLETAYGSLNDPETLIDAVILSAQNAAQDHLSGCLETMRTAALGTPLWDDDPDRFAGRFERIVTDSAAFMLMSRLDIDTNQIFPEDTFDFIRLFKEPETLKPLGTAVCDIAKMRRAMTMSRTYRRMMCRRKPRRKKRKLRRLNPCNQCAMCSVQCAMMVSASPTICMESERSPTHGDI